MCVRPREPVTRTKPPRLHLSFCSVARSICVLPLLLLILSMCLELSLRSYVACGLLTVSRLALTSTCPRAYPIVSPYCALYSPPSKTSYLSLRALSFFPQASLLCPNLQMLFTATKLSLRRISRTQDDRSFRLPSPLGLQLFCCCTFTRVYIRRPVVLVFLSFLPCLDSFSDIFAVMHSTLLRTS